MAKDPRLEKLRNMDPVIGTFTARDIVDNPDFVNQTYLEHAETHMSLGDMSKYVDALLRWVKTNKGAVIGAISGEYGYGKTSTAIYLWRQCEQARILAVPPFEWHRLQDIIDATKAWLCYRIEKIQPESVEKINQIYEKYREKSIQELADEFSITVSKVHELLDQRRINLHCHPEDVIDFISNASKLLNADDLNLYGPIVFTDELQVTMSRYQAERRSRDEFMQDLFELLNPLINKQGSFGIIIGLPLPTEAIINDIRPDISQRMQYCNLFIRPNAMYDRDFPRELWRKFAEVFEFNDISSSILPSDTLDSLGQIAFRDDLGAGPRTVIEAMRCAIDHFDQAESIFTPIELTNSYLTHQVAFDAGGKLVAAVTEVLQSRDVQNIPNGEQVIKLMAAFPMGCPEERFKEYGLNDAKDEISKRIYTEYLYKFPEGISLRKLATSERRAEPRFIQLIKDFIQNYSESERDFDAAVQAFREIVIQERLLLSRRKDQIEGWISDPMVPGQYVGTFDPRFPERKLSVQISRNRADLKTHVEEIGLAFLFDPACDYETNGKVERLSESGKVAVFCLNLLSRPTRPLNLPYIEELGYPSEKITPTFMLAVIHHLRNNQNLVPEEEKRIQIPPLERSLVDYSIQLMFGQDLLENADYDGLTKVGLELPQQVFSIICRLLYPNYETLITTGRWEGAHTTYVGVLNSQKVSSSISALRGNKTLELTQHDVLSLFGETRIQTLKGLIENLSNVLDLDLGTKAEAISTVRFKLHPAEIAFMEALHGSIEKIARGSVELRILEQQQGFGTLRNLGYREEEIGFILQMLKHRHLVDFDPKRQCFLEVIESVTERREAILSTLSDLNQRAEVLSRIPEFEGERFFTETSKLKELVSNCEDVEKLEEYQACLATLRDELNQFTQKWEQTIQLSFDHIRQEVGTTLRSSLPPDLTRPLKSDVSWISELVQCQALIKDKFQRSNHDYRNLENQVTSAWNKWINSSRNDPQALCNLYEANLSALSELKDSHAEHAATESYLRSFVSWLDNLSVASRAHLEATTCAISYKEEQFQIELNAISDEIALRFQKKWLEALPDHEIFEEKIRQIQLRIDTWLRDRRDVFMKAKQFYEETLKSMGVDKYNLHATFDPFDPETSRSNMYSEVFEKTQQYIQLLEQELERFRTETLYAEQVIVTDVSESTSQIKQAKDKLDEVKQQVIAENVHQQENFTKFSIALGELSTSIQEVEKSLRGILRKRDPSPDEEAILNILQDPRGTDLSTVIVTRLVEDGDEFSLDFLMQKITSLFKKNQIIVRLEKRR